MPYDVLIVGAGVAGLAAALEMHRSGLSVHVLEARDRIGGRIFSAAAHGPQTPIELGAEFIHGRPPELFSIAQAADLNPIELGGESWCVLGNTLRPCSFFDRVQPIIEGMNIAANDSSFLAYVRDHVEVADPEDMAWAIAYVRGFHASDPAEISVHSIIHGEQADARIEGDRQFRPGHGYSQLLSWYSAELAGVPIDLNTVVRRVRWSRGHVEIASERNGIRETHSAPRAVLTIPLGVLQSPPGSEGAIAFVPDIPWKRAAAAALRMGRVMRVTLQFRSRFWTSPTAGGPDLSKMQFLFSHSDFFPTWWTMHPMEAPLLVGWAPDRCADRLTGRPREDVIERALRSLERLLPAYAVDVRSQFVAGYLHDWQSDPYSRGAYSYVPSGAEWAQKALAEPVADTLYFAGEACDFAGHHSTVHGAIASGIRAARILRIAKAA